MINNITSDVNIRFGAPCIKGTRIAVADILGYIAGGDTPEDIVNNFPEIKKQDISESLNYASNILNVSIYSTSPAYLNFSKNESLVG